MAISRFEINARTRYLDCTFHEFGMPHMSYPKSTFPLRIELSVASSLLEDGPALKCADGCDYIDPVDVHKFVCGQTRACEESTEVMDQSDLLSLLDSKSLCCDLRFCTKDL